MGVVVSCVFPIWAICERFPVWAATHGQSHSVGVGGILILIVLLIIFRKAVFKFIEEHFNLKHAPPIVIWIVMLIISYLLMYVGKFVYDLTPVFWMGLIGCSIGTGLTFIAEHCFAKKKEEGNSDGQN